MKKIFSRMVFLSLVVLLPSSVMAQVDVNVRINIPLPPPIIFPAPPALIVIPETYVYVAPEIEEEIFFYGGWWWRPWDGRWYRSRHHDRDWMHYKGVPAFHQKVPPGWRNDYRERRWKGHEWDQRRIGHDDAEKNWRNWQRNRHWERENHWGVRGADRRRHDRRGRDDRYAPRPEPPRRTAPPPPPNVRRQPPPQRSEPREVRGVPMPAKMEGRAVQAPAPGTQPLPPQPPPRDRDGRRDNDRDRDRDRGDRGPGPRPDRR